MTDQLHDVHEMYTGAFVVGKDKKLRPQWKRTIHYNLPYAIAKFKKRVAEIDKKYPKGTFFIITKNGISPYDKRK